MRARTLLGVLARVTGAVAALALTGGSLALVSSPAAAAQGTPSEGTPAKGTPAEGTVAFTCTIGKYPAFEYAATISVAGYRAEEGDPVSLRASMSDLPGESPAELKAEKVDSALTLDVAGTTVVLEGSHEVSAAGRAPIPLAAVSGEVASSETDLPVTVKGFGFELPNYGMVGTCTGEKALSVLTVSNEPPPKSTGPTDQPGPNPTNPTNGTNTATPKAPTSAPPAGNPGKPAKGTVKFACVMSIGSKFDYNATISVSGYRKNAGDPVSLQATMSKLPGIAPVPIDGSMEYTLNLSVGGTATTLTATDTVNAPPEAVVPVPTLKGSVKASGDELDVKVSGFSFDFPSASIGAKCTGSGTLSKMTVSSEPPADGDGNGGGGGSSDPAATLPKTGGTNSLPVIGLVAASLVFLGAAGLVWLPSRRGTATRG